MGVVGLRTKTLLVFSVNWTDVAPLKQLVQFTCTTAEPPPVGPAVTLKPWGLPVKLNAAPVMVAGNVTPPVVSLMTEKVKFDAGQEPDPPCCKITVNACAVDGLTIALTGGDVAMVHVTLNAAACGAHAVNIKKTLSKKRCKCLVWERIHVFCRRVLGKSMSVFP